VAQGGTSASGGSLFVTTPTGRGVLVSVSPTLVISNGSYTVIGGETILPMPLPALGNVLVMLNAALYTGSHAITLNIQSGGRSVNVHVYDTNSNSLRINVLGNISPANVRRFTGFTNRSFSMLRARVSVFENEDDTMPTAVMESILELPN